MFYATAIFFVVALITIAWTRLRWRQRRADQILLLKWNAADPEGYANSNKIAQEAPISHRGEIYSVEGEPSIKSLSSTNERRSFGPQLLRTQGQNSFSRL